MSEEKTFFGITLPKIMTSKDRGIFAEKAFIQAWKDPKYHPDWMVSVVPAEEHEDFFQKTDALIIRIGGVANLRIQIKSYFIRDDEKYELMKYGVIPISIKFYERAGKIRKKTYEAIDEFNLFQKEISLGDTKPKRLHQKKKKITFRKRRK